MVALLIGGIIVLCLGFLAIAFGIPVKEFSFGNTMILVGSVVASAGLLLIGLSVVVREFRAIARRLDGRQAVAAQTLSSGSVALPPRPLPPSAPAPQKEIRAGERKDEMLFSRDEPMEHESIDEFDDFADNRFQQPPLPSTNAPSLSGSWQDERPAPQRPDAPERGRRDILFASKRRSANVDVTPLPDANPSDDVPGLDGDQGSDNLNSFENAWPQGERSQRRDTEASRERLQPPRRAEAASVSIVKSGVVDSMAYSLYSDGSIEAQTPEGMVRFGSIEELRSHLDQR